MYMWSAGRSGNFLLPSDSFHSLGFCIETREQQVSSCSRRVVCECTFTGHVTERDSIWAGIKWENFSNIVDVISSHIRSKIIFFDIPRKAAVSMKSTRTVLLRHYRSNVTKKSTTRMCRVRLVTRTKLCQP